jgi:cytosine/adenosine deaminase-related metal-dependent hydrolase
MRAFVEVDPTVGLQCLEAGLELQSQFRDQCAIQLVVFAQDPLLYPADSSKQQRMHDLFEKACQLTHEDTVLGSTPYVQGTYEEQRGNIRLLFDLADRHNRNVDFHLDYNLDEETRPLVWYVLEEAHRRRWKRSITIGHATRLSLFDGREWDRLAEQCRELRVAFIALPPSDLYMQGRLAPYRIKSRATLPLFELEKRGLTCALAVK